MVKVVTRFQDKKPVGKRELIERYIRDSDMFVSGYTAHDGSLTKLWIEIFGVLANIPSLKNSKPKFGGINKATHCKLLALDLLFRRKTHLKNPTFGDQKVFITLITARNKRLTNEDNAFTTIKDWLEPSSKLIGGKNKRARGWGIGLINDDIQARGIAVKAEDIDESPQAHTRIVVTLFSSVKESLNDFVSLTSNGGKNANGA